MQEKIFRETSIRISFYFQLYVKDAELIWSQMLNFKNKDIYMTHDGYLKIYQLSKPKLPDYDCILIDEAQDMSPGKVYYRF